VATISAPQRDADDLDDVADRAELRNRYYGLLQELRVVLPGVQVLLAFLLTVPFANRFGQLDQAGRAAFAIALVGALLSVVCLLTPTVYHRVAERTERSARLAWSIRLTRVGLVLLGVSLITSFWCVARFVYGTATAWLLTTPIAVAIGALWIVIPRASGGRPDVRPAPPRSRIDL
jgi:hypothetical protein